MCGKPWMSVCVFVCLRVSLLWVQRELAHPKPHGSAAQPVASQVAAAASGQWPSTSSALARANSSCCKGFLELGRGTAAGRAISGVLFYTCHRPSMLIWQICPRGPCGLAFVCVFQFLPAHSGHSEFRCRLHAIGGE